MSQAINPLRLYGCHSGRLVRVHPAIKPSGVVTNPQETTSPHAAQLGRTEPRGRQPCAADTEPVAGGSE